MVRLGPGSYSIAVWCSLLVAVGACLTGCSSLAPAVEVGPDGTQVLAVDDDEHVQHARAQIRDGMLRGLSGYRLVQGDVLEVLYLTGARPQVEEYVLGVGDRIKVEFDHAGIAPRELLVRPDGRITLPRKGDVLAAGKTPVILAHELEDLYRDVYREPVVSVFVEQYTSRIEDLRVSLSNLQRGRSQRASVSPDGMVYLPYLPGLVVAGQTVDEARNSINAAYAERFGGLEVSLLLDTVVGNRVFVFGEVARPGMIQLSGPTTTMQALVSAGGHLPTGSLSNVKVLYWSGDESEPRLRSVNLARVLNERRVEEDLVLPPNSTVYVPPTGITEVNRAVDQFLRQLFLFNGTSIGFQRGL